VSWLPVAVNVRSGYRQSMPALPPELINNNWKRPRTDTVRHGALARHRRTVAADGPVSASGNGASVTRMILQDMPCGRRGRAAPTGMSSLTEATSARGRRRDDDVDRIPRRC
jgi:hypothetical protein